MNSEQAEAVLREREACAKICDEIAEQERILRAGSFASRCAYAIRTRGLVLQPTEADEGEG